MKFDSKIVPFERGAAYVHHRAMKNRRDNNPVDALELLRRAVEQSPENREYRLDLAELYCEMGCHRQSNRLLLDLLAEKDAPAECYYGLALNMLGANNAEGARSALRQYLKREPDGVHSEEVRQLQDELDFFEDLRAQRNRRRARAQSVAERACERMREEDMSEARALFERSLRLAPGLREVRGMYAMCLLLQGETDSALEQCDKILRGGDASLRALCLAAQVNRMAGRQDVCEALVEQALQMDPDEMETRMLIFTLCELDLHERVAEITRRALFDTPHDRILLHARAVALVKSGRSAKLAEGYWARILRIDPEDTVAAYFADLAARDALDPEELTYAYQVPPKEYERRLNYIAEKLSASADALTAEWKNNAAFRQLLKWCTGIGNANFQRAAVTVLAAMEDGEAVSVLREYLSRENVPAELKLHASAVLSMRGADMRAFLPASEYVSMGLSQGGEFLLDNLSVGTRQMIRYADDVLRERYDRSALPVLTALWERYRRSGGNQTAALSRPEAASAALAACYLFRQGQEPDFARLCREFGCSSRQLKHYFNCLATTFRRESKEDEETDET